MKREAIERVIPHRAPFLLVDEVIELTPGDGAVALWSVPTDAHWIPGHFPGNPVVPGVLIAESLAQVAAIAALAPPSEHAGSSVFLVGFEKMRFRKPVRPGDTLRLSVRVAERARRIWTFEGEAFVGDDRVANGQFLATIAPPPVSG